MDITAMTAMLGNVEINPEMAVCFLVGVIINILWECIDNKINPLDYIKGEAFRTKLSMVGMIGTFLSIPTLYPEATEWTYVFAGYFVDKSLNKSPKK